MSESHGRIIRKRNPGVLQSDEEVTAQFVVREHELTTVLEVLRGNVDADSCQHTLIVAPRGRGKTMLLARVAAELRADAELAVCLLPVRFMEESDEVFSAADFWLEVLFYLALAIDKQNPKFARSLRETREDLTSRWRERELDERARAAVLEAADTLGSRLVLMVENLQAMCASTDHDFGWKLRKTLQTEPQIILVATATSRFEGLDDAREPFFELFRIVSLAPLNTAQCGRLWEVVSGDPTSEHEIRPLEILTGGSPRFLVIVAGFARHRSMRRLMEELVRLIDDLTDTFRGDLQALPKTERRVFLAIADLWQPSTTGEIADRARMDVRTVSTMLGRLAERGAVIWDGSGRKRLYKAVEPLYCIYYQLRRKRDEAAMVQGLLHFMAGLFTVSEFATIFEKLLLDAAESRTILEGVERARAQIPLVDRVLSSRRWLNAGEFAADERGRRSGTSDAQGLSETIRVLLARGAEQERAGEHAAAVSTYDDIMSRCGASPSVELQVAVAQALVNKGLAQEQLGERTSAIATYDQVVKRFAASEVPALQVQVAAALINKGVAQERDAQHSAAIATCEAVDARYWKSHHPELLAQVACALVNKAVALEQLGKHAAVIATCDELEDRFGTSAAPLIQEQVARALFNKGFAQEQLGIHSVATDTFNEVIERYGATDVEELRAQVAAALNRKGAMRAQAGEHEAAIATCDEIVERNGASDVSQLQEQVGRALVNKGTMQKQLGEHSAAIETYDQVVQQFGASRNQGLRVLTAKCRINKGALHGELGDHTAEMNTYRTLINQYGPSGDPELQAIVAAALFNKALALARSGNRAASISTYDTVVARCGASDVLEQQIRVANALINKSTEHVELGQHADAITTLDEVVQRYGSSDEAELRVCVAQSLVLRAATQDRIGHSEAALMTSEEVVTRFGTCATAKLQLHVASALSHKGALLGELGRHPEALASIEELFERYGDSDDPKLQQVVAHAMNMKGAGHGLLDDPSATIETSDAIIDRFGPSCAPAVQVQVALALFHKGVAQGMTGRVDEAVKTSEELDRRSLAAADGRYAFRWRARHLRMSSLLAQGNRMPAVDAFCSLYAEFLPDKERMVPELVDAVAMLVAAGVPEREIIAILGSEPQNKAVVAPLIIALRQRDGETVRAPAAVLEVAADVRKRIDEAGKRPASEGRVAPG